MVSVVLAPAPGLSRPQDTGLRRSDRRYHKIIWALGAGGFANFMALYFVQPLLPSIAQNFDVSPAAAAATLSVPAIAMALTFIVVGPISDRWGRQLIMRVSLVTTGVLAVAVALAPTWPLLLLARGLEGVALAGLPAVALAYLREEIHVECHLRANSTYIMGTAVGGAAGRLLPGPLEQQLGWHGAAAAIGLLALAASVIMWFLLPHSVNFVPRSVRLTSPDRQHPAHPGRSHPDRALRHRDRRDGHLRGRLQLDRLPPRGGSVRADRWRDAGLSQLSARHRRSRRGRCVGGSLRPRTGRTGWRDPAAHRRDLDRVRPVADDHGRARTARVRDLGHALADHGMDGRPGSAREVGVAQASGTYMVANYLGSSVLGLLANRQWESHGWTGVITLTMITGTAALIAIGAALIIDRQHAVHTRR